MPANQCRVCLFAQFHPRQRIRPPLLTYLAALRSCGYETYVACSGDAPPPEADRAALEATGATLFYRRNAGLDFGAWQHLVRQGCADGADRVLLANDSVFGPFHPLDAVIDRMEAGGNDVWGLIESQQRKWHLQSWFLQFTGDAFRHDRVQRLFAQPFEHMDKDAVIARGELGLGESLRAAGMRCDALIKHRDGTQSARRHTLNMMHLDWAHNLVALGMPFIKIELLRLNPMRLAWTHEWDRLLRERFGADTAPLHEYLYDYTGTSPARPGAPYPVPLLPVPLRLAIGYVFATHDHGMALRGLRRAPLRLSMPPDGLVAKKM